MKFDSRNENNKIIDLYSLVRKYFTDHGLTLSKMGKRVFGKMIFGALNKQFSSRDSASRLNMAAGTLHRTEVPISEILVILHWVMV